MPYRCIKKMGIAFNPLGGVMKSIVIVSQELDKWGAFSTELGNQCQMDVTYVRSGSEALAAAQEKNPIAMVIDQDLGDMTGIDLVPQLLQINALINVAMVSDQSEEAFHESTEGLGILMKLPPRSDARAASDFSKRLSEVI
jgi:CheY-like chemotaxis protein